MSALEVRARAQITGTRRTTSASPEGGLPTSTAMRSTPLRSSGEAAGKPASITSTPRRAKPKAISSFSAEVSAAPGDCSPSRRVVSKIVTWSFFIGCIGWLFIDGFTCLITGFDRDGVQERHHLAQIGAHALDQVILVIAALLVEPRPAPAIFFDPGLRVAAILDVFQ